MDNTQLVLLGLAVVLAVGLGVVLWRRRGKAVEIPQPTVEKAAGLTRAAGEAGAAVQRFGAGNGQLVHRSRTYPKLVSLKGG
jgi:LPXTG-motif cell wall-anchored protein